MIFSSCKKSIDNLSNEYVSIHNITGLTDGASVNNGMLVFTDFEALRLAIGHIDDFLENDSIQAEYPFGDISGFVSFYEYINSLDSSLYEDSIRFNSLEQIVDFTNLNLTIVEFFNDDTQEVEYSLEPSIYSSSFEWIANENRSFQVADSVYTINFEDLEVVHESEYQSSLIGKNPASKSYKSEVVIHNINLNTSVDLNQCNTSTYDNGKQRFSGEIHLTKIGKIYQECGFRSKHRKRGLFRAWYYKKTKSIFLGPVNMSYYITPEYGAPQSFSKSRSRQTKTNSSSIYHKIDDIMQTGWSLGVSSGSGDHGGRGNNNTNYSCSTSY